MNPKGGSMVHRLMTEDEKDAIIMKSIELMDAGKEAEGHALMKTYPMFPWLAKVFKEKVGADFLIEAGFNLAEAEAQFGPGWLTR
ncbi:MAG: hypothetical protein LBR16_07180 [Treponema sp.]|jgi:hypothetical protein|nr:hypothetical protein [Treponema sp.]